MRSLHIPILALMLLSACATAPSGKGGGGGGGGVAGGQGCDRLATEHRTLAAQYAALDDRQNGVALDQTKPPPAPANGRPANNLAQRLQQLQTRMAQLEAQNITKGCPPLS